MTVEAVIGQPLVSCCVGSRPDAKHSFSLIMAPDIADMEKLLTWLQQGNSVISPKVAVEDLPGMSKTPQT
jgi:hypothetical protein